MHKKIRILFFSLTIAIIAVVPSIAANRTSIGLLGGIGQPVGWWSERWDAHPMGEVNLRYEVMPGTGLLLLTGLNSVSFSSLSSGVIFNESIVRSTEEEFLEYGNITQSDQTGTFRQTQLGMGFYHERMLAQFRSYFSLAGLVSIWQFDRKQVFTYVREIPNYTQVVFQDNWKDTQDGANFGGQAVVGLLYQISSLIYIDISAAYQVMTIDQEHAAVAYWGKPARTFTNDQIKKAEKRADAFQLRVGLRYGR